MNLDSVWNCLEVISFLLKFPKALGMSASVSCSNKFNQNTKAISFKMPNQISKVRVFQNVCPEVTSCSVSPRNLCWEWGHNHSGKGKDSKHRAKIAWWWANPLFLLGLTTRPPFPGPMQLGVTTWHCEPYSLCLNHSTLPLLHESSYGQPTNKCVCCVPTKP